jgi:hypothetical protein
LYTVIGELYTVLPPGIGAGIQRGRARRLKRGLNIAANEILLSFPALAMAFDAGTGRCQSAIDR